MSKAYHNIGQALSSNFHADCLKLSAAALMCNLRQIKIFFHLDKNCLDLQAGETLMVCHKSKHVSVYNKVNRSFKAFKPVSCSAQRGT
jgi:hypothetical protein